MIGKAKKIKVLKWGIILGVLVCLAVFAISNFNVIKNVVQKVFLSPEEYYKIVETTNSEETINNIVEIYGSQKEKAKMISESGLKGDLKIELDDNIRDILERTVGLDCTGFEDVQLVFERTGNNAIWKNKAEIAINDTAVVSGTIIGDVDNYMIYAQMPEVYNNYLGISTGDLIYKYNIKVDALCEVNELLQEVYSMYPDEKCIDELLRKYSEIIIDCIEDVETKEDKVSVKGITTKCTKLESVFDSEAIYEVLETIIEEILDDDELEEMCIQLFSRQDMSKRKYDELMSMLEEILEELDILEYLEAELVITLWVDKKGVVIGRSMELEDFLKIECLMPSEGNEFGFELTIETDKSIGDIDISLSGEGKNKGNKIEGDFELEISGEEIIGFAINKMDLKDLYKGNVNADITFKFSDKALSMVYDKKLRDLLNEDLQVIIKNSSKESEIAVNCLDGNKNVCSFELGITEAKGEKVKLPSEKESTMIDDTEDLYKYLKALDFSRVAKNFKKADISNEILEKVENYINSYINKYETSIEYDKATDMLNNAEYNSAMEAFKKLGDYSDSKERAILAEGMLYFNENDYVRAMELLSKVKEYPLAKTNWNECMYQIALEYINAMNFDSAIPMLEQISGYKDADNRLEKIIEGTKISIMLPGGSDEYDYLDLTIKFRNRIEEYTRTKITWELYDESTYNKKVNDKLASGELPTLLVMEKNSNFDLACEYNLFWDLTGYIDMFDNLSVIPVEKRKNASLGTKLYGIPRIQDDKVIAISTSSVTTEEELMLVLKFLNEINDAEMRNLIEFGLKKYDYYIDEKGYVVSYTNSEKTYMGISSVPYRNGYNQLVSGYSCLEEQNKLLSSYK